MLKLTLKLTLNVLCFNFNVNFNIFLEYLIVHPLRKIKTC